MALTTGVPVIVNPVTVAVVQIVAALPVNVMLPASKAIVRVLLLLELNNEQVSVLPLISSVPAVKLNAVADVLVKLSASFTVPVGLLTVSGCVHDTPADVIV